jgi:tetratricopeptide (TPR) repeat protein
LLDPTAADIPILLKGNPMTDSQAIVHLQRAFKVLQEVEKKTDDLRGKAAAHSTSVDEDKPFVQGLISAYAGSRHLSKDKETLLADLQLANGEIDVAAQLDPAAAITTEQGGSFAIPQARGLMDLLRGHIELAWGSPVLARQHLFKSLEYAEFPETHFFLGLIYEDVPDPANALIHFEKYLQLDPNGEFSVGALREANAMRHYKKRFRGSWGLFAVLCLFCIPVAPVYYFMKRK